MHNKIKGFKLNLKFVKATISMLIFLVIVVLGVRIISSFNTSRNVLIVGYKGPGTDDPYYTDTIIVAHVDAKMWKIKTFSIPRDLFVQINSKDFGAINTVVPLARRKEHKSTDEGIMKLRDVIQNITDVKIQQHISINLTGLNQLIDAVGGLQIQVDKAINDPNYPKNTKEIMNYKVDTGTYEMNAEEVERFIRSRHDTSDYDRSKRQQQVIQKLTKKIITPRGIRGIMTHPALFENYSSSMSTVDQIGFILQGAIFERDSIALQGRCDPKDSTFRGCVMYSPQVAGYQGPTIVLPIGSNLGEIDNYDLLKKYIADYLK